MRCYIYVFKQKGTIFKFSTKEFYLKGLIKNYLKITIFSDNLIGNNVTMCVRVYNNILLGHIVIKNLFQFFNLDNRLDLSFGKNIKDCSILKSYIL